MTYEFGKTYSLYFKLILIRQAKIDLRTTYSSVSVTLTFHVMLENLLPMVVVSIDDKFISL